VSTLEFIHKPYLYFRVDCGPTIGLGHFIRSAALAEMLSGSFYCVLVTHDLPTQLFSNGNNYFNEAIIMDQPDAYSLLACLPEKSRVVLDGYDFDYDYQRILKEQDHFLVSIDDIQKTHFISNIVINHGVNIKAENYSCEPSTKLFTGLEYMMLRKPFFNIMRQKRVISHAETLLIIPGGNDIKNISVLLLENGIHEHFKQVHIISGAGALSAGRLTELARNRNNVIVHQNLTADQLIKIARNCDICIGTPSGVSYELSCIGIGLVLCLIAENQHHFFDFFIDNELAKGCIFNDYSSLPELLNLLFILKNDTELINLQVAKQKLFFSTDSKENLLKIFMAII
jgi:spore coat polysaccharide biosynthesis predicted glycosyltransferase SpsG